MKTYSITIKNVNDYSTASKLYMIANECCVAESKNDLPQIIFTFINKSERDCFKHMVKHLKVFSKNEIQE